MTIIISIILLALIGLGIWFIIWYSNASQTRILELKRRWIDDFLSGGIDWKKKLTQTTVIILSFILFMFITMPVFFKLWFKTFSFWITIIFVYLAVTAFRAKLKPRGWIFVGLATVLPIVFWFDTDSRELEYYRNLQNEEYTANKPWVKKSVTNSSKVTPDPREENSHTFTLHSDTTIWRGHASEQRIRMEPNSKVVMTSKNFDFVKEFTTDANGVKSSKISGVDSSIFRKDFYTYSLKKGTARVEITY